MSNAEIIGRLREMGSTDRDAKLFLVRRMMQGFVMKRVPFYFQILYRARRVRSAGLFTNLSDLWCPPPQLVRSFGRAHSPGQPVFYAAENPHTALKETTSPGSVSACLEIELKDPAIGPFHFAIGADELLRRRGDDVQSRNDPTVEAFLVEEFRKERTVNDVSPYELSSLIAKVFFDCQSLDGLLYPSVPFGLDWLNVALRPDSVDRLYSPRDIQVFINWQRVWARIGTGSLTSGNTIVYQCEHDAIANLPGVSAEAKTTLLGLFGS